MRDEQRKRGEEREYLTMDSTEANAAPTKPKELQVWQHNILF